MFFFLSFIFIFYLFIFFINYEQRIILLKRNSYVKDGGYPSEKAYLLACIVHEMNGC